MSRGGFKGRGRGGGPGGIGRDFVIPTGSDMTKNDWIEAMKARPQHSGMLFPPLDSKSVAVLNAPEVFEDHMLEYSATIHDLLHKGSDIPGHSAPTPWRMVGERKVVGIEIETWSGSTAENDPSTTGSSDIDAASMFLDKSLFPPALWKEVFENVTSNSGNKRKREEKERERRRKRMEQGDEGNEDDKSADEDKSQAGSEDDGDGDFDFEDDEEEDHQDYDANYFDNGEGDDDDDGVADDDAGDGGGNSWE